MKYIDKEEKEVVESYNSDEWKSIKGDESRLLIDAANSNFIKDKRINIRLTTKDYLNIKAKALEEGIPYQTLISSIIHKYNSGKLKSTT